MKIAVYTLRSFAKTLEGGNPAGVVLDAESLSEKQMLLIAKKVGFSETAFVTKSDKADFKVRFFTPTDEVGLCGHATIATYFLLWDKKQINKGKYQQETKAGILGIEVRDDGRIFMNQDLPKYLEKLDKDTIADSLNIPTNYLDSDLPVQIVSTGLKDIMVPVKSIKNLLSIEPDLKKITDICKQNEAIGYHVFTLETELGSTAHCRNFAPLYGIPEESATGTSNGALSCYLFKYGKLKNSNLNHLVFEQGYSMNAPSEILAELVTSEENIEEVKVGGRAIITKELLIEI